MEPNSLLSLSTSELRTLLILKIRNFTNALELGDSIISLEKMREEMRAITEVLKAKELGDAQHSVERTTQPKDKDHQDQG